jgi:glutathione synthase/RimK-type ligase-like ATP-grasp enzyme
MKIGIFTSFQDNEIIHQAIESCKSLNVDYEVIDITCEDWIDNVKKSNCSGFFCPSNCVSQELKSIQDERYYFVSQVMNRPIYPDFLGLYIHENKRNMAAWLELNNYPHSKTRVFTDRNEALQYLSECNYPIVTKANVGAGASKVRIVKSQSKAKQMAKKALSKGLFGKAIFIFSPGLYYISKLKGIKFPDLQNPQKDYFIVQDYVKDVLWEWRILKIGDNYFGHQKLLKGEFASGSGMVGWVAPPKHLLKMVRELCQKGGFECMDVDIFETKDGKFLINELQASFGSYLDYQMCIDGRHGRYKDINGEFVFEEGDFNVHGSTKLKIEHFAKLLSDNNL